MTLNPETTQGVSTATEEPRLEKGVIKLPGVLFVAIAAMAPGAGTAHSISTGAMFG